MSTFSGSMESIQMQETSVVIVTLLKGVLYREDNMEVWRNLWNHQAAISDYVAVMGLILVIDDSEGYAFLSSAQREDEGGSSTVPRLIIRRQLSYPVSLLLALLRKKLAEFDASGSETRLILTRDEVIEMIRVFMPLGSNDVKMIDQIDATLNKISDLGFIRRLRGQGNTIEVRRIIKAFVDAQWLSDFNDRLAEYQRQVAGKWEGMEDV